MTINEDHFEQEVSTSSLPVLVHFWAPWCGLCRMVTPILHRFQSEWADQVRVIDVNADDSLRLANFYQLTTLPTLLFMQHGQVVQRFEGLRGRDELKRILDSLMQQQLLEQTLLQ
ncbi:MAG: thioredoxin [Leptolyngbya sp. SIO4C1]|nr:thioredoxin [Leptolyngbya sp. SIO4C1]